MPRKAPVPPRKKHPAGSKRAVQIVRGYIEQEKRPGVEPPKPRLREPRFPQ